MSTLLSSNMTVRCKDTLKRFSISPLFLSIVMGLILSGLLFNDLLCYRSDTCLPTRTTYRVQFIVLLSHLTAIGLFLFAYVHAVEVNLRMHRVLAVASGYANTALFILRTVLELVYIDYHSEDYVKD